jgi:cytochrome c553
VNKILTTIVLAALWPVVALSQTPAWIEMKGELKAALEKKGDPVRGAVAFETCEGCHRKDASGRVSGAYPRLSGQHATVLIKQIVDIRAGRRSNPKMEPFLDDHALTAFEIADIGAHLQGLPVSTDNGKGAGNAIAAGKQIYDKDCANCHGSNGEGSAAKFFPMVAAQHYRYLLREMQYIRDGDRRNANPDMINVIKPYANSDLEALADYMSRLGPPKK